jgi:hypothetical protein
MTIQQLIRLLEALPPEWRVQTSERPLTHVALDDERKTVALGADWFDVRTRAEAPEQH